MGAGRGGRRRARWPPLKSCPAHMYRYELRLLLAPTPTRRISGPPGSMCGWAVEEKWTRISILRNSIDTSNLMT